MRKIRQIFQTWQLWNATLKTLGADILAALLGVNKSMAYEYAKNPNTTGPKRCRDKAEQMHAVLSELAFWGREDVCRGFVDYFRSAYEDVTPNPVGELKPTMNEEILADYQSVASLQAAIDRCDEIDIVEALTNAAKEDIDRTYAKYLKDCK